MMKLEIIKIALPMILGVYPCCKVEAEDVHEHGAVTEMYNTVLNPLNVLIKKPEDIRWSGKEGEQKALLFGNPEKQGTYAMLIRWSPGHYSKPHFHSRDRNVYILSGNWWMSTEAHFDPHRTVPVPAGSFVVQKAGTVHWDGAFNEPCELLLVGEGPVTTTWLDQPSH